MAPHPEQVVISTTIAPQGDINNQQIAIHTWVECGFKVIAVNTPEEITFLKSAFPFVEFIPAERTGSKKYQKPYIYLDDILKCLYNYSSRISGIVNSDIHFLNKNIHSCIYREANSAFVFGSRIDIESFSSINSGKNYAGFDYFFFDKRIIPCFPKDEFCLGLPWWDYWIILIPLAYKIPVKRITVPFAYHLIHTPGNLDTNSWIPLGIRLAKYFTPQFEVSSETMGLYNQLLYSYINNNPRIICIECI